ncbi:CMRF35-like molecule 8 [Oreochromis aureus]|uniref:CMRF35-like molecule 8 n=1 Tax=Oreochromis aureus TaxID=47969 RepID=UPI001952A979|nr:CMRF35-like molecule 8 [Oreochromis aureus]
MVSAESPRQSNRFTFTKTNRNFSLSISNVSSQDEGVYWCGVKLKKEVVIKKIHLTVKAITNFTRSPAAGQNFTYWCKCEHDASPSKSICKGDDPSICQPLVTTSEPDKNKKFFINDKDKTNITVTIVNVTADDSGTYWCGAKSDDQHRSNAFCNRLNLTVGSPPTSTSPISSTTATTTAAAAAAGRRGVSEAIISVIVCVAVLLFVILMILIYKRFSDSKNTGNGAAACRTKEDCTYEEIQERLQLPDSENATNTIYATVSSPNPAPSTHYATINFQNSDEAAGETVRLSYSACEYSTVKFPKCPTDSSDTQLYRPTEEPLYSTVNKPRK